MTKQQQIATRLALQHEKGFLGHLAQAIPLDQMEPDVRRVYEQKQVAVAEMEKRLRGS